jgi:hypothetical protein
MSFLSALGSLGIGLVWGWLAARITVRPPRLALKNLKPWIALAAGSAALWGTLAAALGWRLALAFLAGAAIAYLIHQSWRRRLRRRIV